MSAFLVRSGRALAGRRRRSGAKFCWFATQNDPPKQQSQEDLVQWKISEHNYHIGLLTLNSTKTYNALTVEMGREFSALVQRLIHEELTTRDIRAIILTGAQDNAAGSGGAFSAGGNLSWLHSLRDNSIHANVDLMMTFYNYFLCIRRVPVPVIAALNGPAMGAGAGLALACDLRVAVPQPRILGLHFSRLGIHAGMGASHYLRLALPSSTAVNEILLMGKTLSGQEAFDFGLVNRLTSSDADDAALETAYEMALELTQQHPVALRLLTQTLRAQQDVGLQQALQREALAQAICYSRNDWGEGVTATAEKRLPEFDGYHEK